MEECRMEIRSGHGAAHGRIFSRKEWSAFPLTLFLHFPPYLAIYAMLAQNQSPREASVRVTVGTFNRALPNVNPY